MIHKNRPALRHFREKSVTGLLLPSSEKQCFRGESIIFLAARECSDRVPTLPYSSTERREAVDEIRRLGWRYSATGGSGGPLRAKRPACRDFSFTTSGARPFGTSPARECRPSWRWR